MEFTNRISKECYKAIRFLISSGRFTLQNMTFEPSFCFLLFYCVFMNENQNIKASSQYRAVLKVTQNLRQSLGSKVAAEYLIFR